MNMLTKNSIMEKIYEEVAIEMGLQGWTEEMNLVADDMIRAVWKKKGDVGEWMYLMEYDKNRKEDTVLCLMKLSVGKKFGAKCETPLNVLRGAGVVPVLNTLRRGVERLLEKTTGGGEVCQSL